MTMMHKIKISLLSCAAVMGLTACSQTVGTVSSDEIYTNIFNVEKEAISYYAESFLTFDEEETMVMKEWSMSDGRSRTEAYEKNELTSYAINDNKAIWSYDVASNEVFSFEMTVDDETNTTQSVSEQAKLLLNLVKDTHDLEFIGSDKVAERDTIHVKAVPKQNKETTVIFGEMNMWIDKETWFPLKVVTESEYSSTIAEYTKFEVNPDIEDRLFVFVMPEGAQIVDLDNLYTEIDVATIADVREQVDRPFYYVEEIDGLMIHNLNMQEYNNESKMKEVTFEYAKEGIPFFSLYLTTIDAENELFDGEGINIRGQKANYDEMSHIKMLVWSEDGIGYTLFIEDESISKEYLIQLVESMKLYE